MRVVFASLFALCGVIIAIGSAHEPEELTPQSIKELKEAGVWEDALLRLKWLRQHRMDDSLSLDAEYRLREEELRAKGLSDTDVALELYGPSGVQRALPWSVPPELKAEGSPKTLTILVDFKDHRASDELQGLTPERIRQNIYGNGTEVARGFSPFESARTYYERASEGKLTLDGDVLGWHSFDSDRESYQPAPVATDGLTERQIEYRKFVAEQKALFKIATEALDAFESSDEGHDFAQYDNDNDGDIDCLTILYAGPRGTWSSFWWAYQWSFQISEAQSRLYDGKRLKQFVFQFVDVRSEDDFNPRTLIHEFGHALGLPDYYDYDSGLPDSDRLGPDGGLGGLDIMDGNWGNHNAFSRWLLDWIKPEFVGSGESIEKVLVASGGEEEGAKAIAVFPGLEDSDAPAKEMYILEYRKRIGNDVAIPADGLLVWKVDGRPNARDDGFELDNSYTDKKLIRLMRADSSDDFGNRERATGRVFFTGNGIKLEAAGGNSVVVSDLEFDGNKAVAFVGIQPDSQPVGSRDNQLLEQVRALVETTVPTEIRLRQIDGISKQMRTAKVTHIKEVWYYLSKTAFRTEAARETEILAQNCLLSWTSKDGLGARDALSQVAKKEATAQALYPAVMATWASCNPNAASDWLAKSRGDEMGAPGKDFTRRVVDHLKRSENSSALAVAATRLRLAPTDEAINDLVSEGFLIPKMHPFTVMVPKTKTRMVTVMKVEQRTREVPYVVNVPQTRQRTVNVTGPDGKVTTKEENYTVSVPESRVRRETYMVQVPSQQEQSYTAFVPETRARTVYRGWDESQDDWRDDVRAIAPIEDWQATDLGDETSERPTLPQTSSLELRGDSEFDIEVINHSVDRLDEEGGLKVVVELRLSPKNGPNTDTTEARDSRRVDVMSYNLESGEANIGVLAAEMAEFKNVDLFGFSEVANQEWADELERSAEAATGDQFGQILGTTGGSDRLLILYREDLVTYEDDFELHRINPRVNGRRRVRSALVGRFLLRATNEEFLFMVNHLYRGRADKRHEQSDLLNDWAANQGVPVIAVGDFNYDWEVNGGDADHDKGYDNLTRNDVFKWVRPDTLIKTQTSPRFDSVLDFVFASGEAQGYAIDSTIVVRSGDEPDNPEISDHRPVLARFDFPSVAPAQRVTTLSTRRPMKWNEEEEDLSPFDPAFDLEFFSDDEELSRLESGQD